MRYPTGTVVQKAKKLVGCTFASFSELVGISRGRLKQMYAGETLPQVDECLRIIDVVMEAKGKKTGNDFAKEMRNALAEGQAVQNKGLAKRGRRTVRLNMDFVIPQGVDAEKVKEAFIQVIGELAREKVVA